MAEIPALAEVVEAFSLPGKLLESSPYGEGHIHETFLAVCGSDGEQKRFIFQRLNPAMLVDVSVQMGNLERILRHLASKESNRRKRPTLVPTKGGRAFWNDPSGAVWRAFEFIEGSKTIQTVRTPDEAREAARVFGGFLKQISDMEPLNLPKGLPHFHDAGKYFLQLEKSVAEDSKNRAAGAKPEIDFALKRRVWTGVLPPLIESGELTQRVVHNDTKINNVLFDAESGEGLCAIDLDTVMPGLILYDFGDLVRSCVSATSEDERSAGEVSIRRPIFEALAKGFLEQVDGLITPAERKQMVFACQLIAFELGSRFLADHLSGDAYFGAARENQNLDRCRAQFRLAELFEREREALEKMFV